MRNLAKYAAHICCTFFYIFSAYASSSDGESKSWFIHRSHQNYWWLKEV